MKHYILIRHKVRDYSFWRTEFDSLLQWRKSCGEKNIEVYRDEDDLNLVTLICEWDSIEKAKKFISNTLLSEKMQLSGVMEQPLIHLLKKE